MNIVVLKGNMIVDVFYENIIPVFDSLAKDRADNVVLVSSVAE